MSRVLISILTLGLGGVSMFGQVTPPAAVQPQPASSIRPDYTLGPNDQILVRSSAEELNDRPFRVDAEGFITFPLVNRIQVSGQTVQSLEQDLITRLREFYQQPQVGITVTGYRSEPVLFLGAFKQPGLYALTGGRTLVEMLAVAGGFLPNAERRIRVTRRAEYGPIPLASAIQDRVTGSSSVEISLESLVEINSADDIVLQAYDRVSVELALPIYVVGEVTRPAPVELTGRESITVMQALSQAGGFNATASRGKIQVLRPIEGTTRLASIKIDLERIVNGLDNDFPLFSNDILYIPKGSVLATLGPQAASSMLGSLPYIIISALLTNRRSN